MWARASVGFRASAEFQARAPARFPAMRWMVPTSTRSRPLDGSSLRPRQLRKRFVEPPQLGQRDGARGQHLDVGVLTPREPIEQRDASPARPA